MRLFTNVTFESEHSKISFRSMKDYSDEISMEQEATTMTASQ